MKKYTVICLFAGMLIGCTNETASNNSEQKIQTNAEDTISSINQLEEYSVLEEETSISNHKATIVEDNPHKRVIKIKTKDNGQEYKSIFVKETNRLKLIQFDKGVIFNDVIT